VRGTKGIPVARNSKKTHTVYCFLLYNIQYNSMGSVDVEGGAALFLITILHQYGKCTGRGQLVAYNYTTPVWEVYREGAACCL
jgi:hypothetical protein